MALTDAQKAKLVKLGQLATFKQNADNAYYHDVEYDTTNKKIVKKTKSKNGSGEWVTTTSDVVTQATLKEDLGINALESANGQPNVIDTVKVNGTALTPDANKAVDVKVELVEKTTATTGYLKTYQLKVNNVAQATEINIPKDLVVTSGSVVAGTWSNNSFTESAQGTGKALKLGIANQTDPVYINVADLCDVYTPNNASGAKVTIAIDANNGISASITAGSIEKTDLASGVQTSLGKADSAYQLPSGGITTADLASGVVASLGKADTALQSSDIKDKANKSEMSVEAGTGANADKTTITLKTGTSATVLTAHQSISGKADKVASATNGNFAGLDSNGNLTDSGKKAADFQAKVTANGLLKGNGSGTISAAVAGTDYQAPLTAGTDYQTPLVAGTDYQTPLTAGTDYVVPVSGKGLSSNDFTDSYKGILDGLAYATDEDIAALF